MLDRLGIKICMRHKMCKCTYKSWNAGFGENTLSRRQATKQKTKLCLEEHKKQGLLRMSYCPVSQKKRDVMVG